MPYSPKTHNFMALCSTLKGRSKARKKCPTVKVARKLMKEGIKRS